MKTITRVIKTTTITAQTVEVINGVVTPKELTPTTTVETVTEKNAERIFRKLSGIDKKTPVFITDVHTKEITYTMSIETFISNAETVTE